MGPHRQSDRRPRRPPRAHRRRGGVEVAQAPSRDGMHDVRPHLTAAHRAERDPPRCGLPVDTAGRDLPPRAAQGPAVDVGDQTDLRRAEQRHHPVGRIPRLWPGPLDRGRPVDLQPRLRRVDGRLDPARTHPDRRVCPGRQFLAQARLGVLRRQSPDVDPGHGGPPRHLTDPEHQIGQVAHGQHRRQRPDGEQHRADPAAQPPGRVPGADSAVGTGDTAGGRLVVEQFGDEVGVVGALPAPPATVRTTLHGSSPVPPHAVRTGRCAGAGPPVATGADPSRVPWRAPATAWTSRSRGTGYAAAPRLRRPRSVPRGFPP